MANVGGRQISSEYHYIANGYSNSWYVNKTGTYTITLEFWPQNFVSAGTVISVTTIIIGTVYTIYVKVIVIKKIQGSQN